MAEIHVQSETPRQEPIFHPMSDTGSVESVAGTADPVVETPDAPEVVASFTRNITLRMALVIGRPVCSVSPTSSGDEKRASRVWRTFPECAEAGVGSSHVVKLPRWRSEARMAVETHHVVAEDAATPTPGWRVDPANEACGQSRSFLRGADPALHSWCCMRREGCHWQDPATSSERW